MHRQQVPYSSDQLKKRTALKLVLIALFMISVLQQMLLVPAKWTAISCNTDETPEINSRSRPGKYTHVEGANLSKQRSFIYANY